LDPLTIVSASVGALELLMAAVAIYYSTKSSILSWLKYFALGLVLLSLAHLSFLKELSPLFFALGLPLVALSILSALNSKRFKTAIALAAIFSGTYLLGAYLYRPLQPLGEVLLFTALPVAAAYEVYVLYEEMRSAGLFLFFLGLVAYAFATDVRLVLTTLQLWSEVKALTVEMLMKMVGIALMLGGFLLA